MTLSVYQLLAMALICSTVLVEIIWSRISSRRR